MNGLQFIEGGVPMTNRIWFEVDDSLNKSMVMEILNEHIQSSPQCFSLETNFFISKASDQINNNLIDILQDIYQIKVGYEKSFPVVSIYYPFAELDQNTLQRINDRDLYRPGIHLYLLVTEHDLFPDNSLSSMRDLAGKIFTKVLDSQDLALDTTVYLLLTDDPDQLDHLLELRRLIYTWDTSVNINKPLVQVSPLVKFNSNMTEKLGRYIHKEGDLLAITNTLCGLTSLMVRYRENNSVPTKYIPLGGCGAGVSEKKYRGDGMPPSVCFYACSTFRNDVFKECQNCNHVANCTGCFLMCTELPQCSLKDVFDTYAKTI